MAQSGPKLSVAETSAICPIADLSTRCPRSTIYGRQSQFSVVAGPRNQRYLHPRSVGAGVPICEVDEGCQLAIVGSRRHVALLSELPVLARAKGRLCGAQFKSPQPGCCVT